MTKNRNWFYLKRLIVAILFTATVVFLTHIPEEAIPARLKVSGLSNILHPLLYAAITLLFIFSLRISISLLSASILFFAIVGVGAIDELTQPFFSRTFSLFDWLLDIIGIVSALLFFAFLKKFKHRTLLNTDK